MAKKINDTKLKTYGILTALFVVVGLGLTILTSVIAYPTQSHKQVGAALAEINNTAFRDGDVNITTTPEYKRLNEHQNTVYSNWVGGIGTFVQLVVWVVMIVLAYRHLRKYRLAKNPALAIGFIGAVTAVLTIIPSDLFIRAYAGIAPPFGYELPIVIITIVMTFLFSLLVTWLVAKIVEWKYNRSHGFIED